MLHGVELPYDYKISMFPEAVFNLLQTATGKTSTVDFNKRTTSSRVDTSLAYHLASVVLWLDKHNWSLNSSKRSSKKYNQNQLTGFGNDSTKLKKLLLKRAGLVCPKRKHLNTELVVLTSHSTKGKYYAYYNFDCKE